MRLKFNVKGLILSGGPSSVYEEDAPKIDPRILGLEIPILGLCYGHQLIAHILGGKVTRGTRQEYGITYVTIVKPVGVLKGLGPREKVWMSHGDTVQSLPGNLEVLAYSEACPVAAYRDVERSIYGLQWHPEVTHTEHGAEMLRNFIFEVCGCRPNWSPSSNIEDEIKKIKGKGKAVIALSGGIDSSTAAILAAKVLGENLIPVFVDHGFMREGEGELVKETFKRMGVNVLVVDAKESFMKKLKGVVDPEEKRKIIGSEFIKVFEEIPRRWVQST